MTAVERALALVTIGAVDDTDRRVVRVGDMTVSASGTLDQADYLRSVLVESIADMIRSAVLDERVGCVEICAAVARAGFGSAGPSFCVDAIKKQAPP